MVPAQATTVQAQAPELRELPTDLEGAPAIARWLKMSLTSFHNQRQAPVDPLPAYRIGERWFASRREVLAWIARRSRPSAFRPAVGDRSVAV